MTSPITNLAIPCSPEKADEFISRPQERVIKALKNITGDVMVLGAGGKMGLHLSMMLRAAFDASGMKNRVIAVSRFGGLRSTEAFESCGIETIPCDLADPAQLAKLPDIPNIFFMAGAKFGTANNTGLLHQMNVVVPQQVAERFKNSRIVAYSTGCVYSFVTPETGGSTEASPTAPPGEYAESCLGRENAFEKGAKDYGTKVALIRLNYAVEFHYGVLVDICQKVISGTPVDVSMGYANVIWQGDAIAYSLLALEHCANPPFILNVTGDSIISVRDIATKFGRMLGKEVQITGKEEPTAWLNNASKSHQLFGPQEVALDQMMEWVAAWLITTGKTHGKPTGFEIRDGKY